MQEHSPIAFLWKFELNVLDSLRALLADISYKNTLKKAKKYIDGLLRLTRWLFQHLKPLIRINTVPCLREFVCFLSKSC